MAGVWLKAIVVFLALAAVSLIIYKQFFVHDEKWEEEQAKLLAIKNNCKCKNDGKPTFDLKANKCKCLCKAPWTGEFCESCGIQPSTCKSRSATLDTKTCKCKCPDPACYNGGYLQNPITSSSDATQLDCKCHCLAPFTGTQCEVCGLKKCKNNGFPDINCRCHCPPPYVGAFCEGVRILMVTHFLGGIDDRPFTQQSFTKDSSLMWIGEEMLQISLLLSSAGHKVSILYTNLDADLTTAQARETMEFLSIRSIEFIALKKVFDSSLDKKLRHPLCNLNDESACKYEATAAFAYQRSAYHAFAWLLKHDQDYEVVETHDYGGISYYIAEAKKMGILFNAAKKSRDTLGVEWGVKLVVHAFLSRYYQQSVYDENLDNQALQLKSMEAQLIHMADFVTTHSVPYLRWMNSTFSLDITSSETELTEEQFAKTKYVEIDKFAVMPFLIDSSNVQSVIDIDALMYVKNTMQGGEKNQRIVLNRSDKVLPPAIQFSTDRSSITNFSPPSSKKKRSHAEKNHRIIFYSEHESDILQLISILADLLKFSSAATTPYEVLLLVHASDPQKYANSLNDKLSRYIQDGVSLKLQEQLKNVQYMTKREDSLKAMNGTHSMFVVLSTIKEKYLLLELLKSNVLTMVPPAAEIVETLEMYLGSKRIFEHVYTTRRELLDKLVDFITGALEGFRNDIMSMEAQVHDITTRWLEWHEKIFKVLNAPKKHKIQGNIQDATFGSQEDQRILSIPAVVIIAFENVRAVEADLDSSQGTKAYLHRLIDSIYRQRHKAYQTLFILPNDSHGRKIKSAIDTYVKEYNEFNVEVHLSEGAFSISSSWSKGAEIAIRKFSTYEYLIFVSSAIASTSSDIGQIMLKPSFVSTFVLAAEESRFDAIGVQEDVLIIKDGVNRQWDDFDFRLLYEAPTYFASQLDSMTFSSRTTSSQQAVLVRRDAYAHVGGFATERENEECPAWDMQFRVMVNKLKVSDDKKLVNVGLIPEALHIVEKRRSQTDESTKDTQRVQKKRSQCAAEVFQRYIATKTSPALEGTILRYLATMTQ